MGEQRKILYRDIEQKMLSVETVKDVSAFDNNAVPLAQAFLSEFIRISWLSLSTITSWDQLTFQEIKIGREEIGREWF